MRPPERGSGIFRRISWHCCVSMFEKRVSQSERRIRNSHVTSMRTGTPLGSNSNCQVYTLALESAHTPKAHDNRAELRNKRHRADSAMPRNPAKDSRPSFGRAHVRVWERDYRLANALCAYAAPAPSRSLA